MPAPAAQDPGPVTLVLGTVAGGTGTHVLMLADGLASRGIRVSVAGPLSADRRFSFSALPAVSFAAVEIGDRPRAGDIRVLGKLRKLLARSSGDGDGDGHVVHAHGLRAGALTVLALLGARRRPAIVVTVHNAPPPGGGAAGLVYRVLERVAARGADAVLCVSPDLEARLRAAGAHRVGPAVVAAPDLPPAEVSTAEVPAAGPTTVDGSTVDGSTAGLTTADGTTTARPLVLAVGRLAAQKGFAALLDAAVTWQDLNPRPRVLIAGDGSLAAELRARAAALGVDAEFPGHAGDVSALLAAAAVFVLPSQWEGQPLVLQEALRAGVPVVATRVGGVPGLAGDAALLVPPGDTGALAAAVRSVLTDPARAAGLRAAATARATDLPTGADAVGNALACYAAATGATQVQAGQGIWDN